MSYAVKEIFLTLQGEGAHAGRAADILMFGRESAGVPDDVLVAADARLVIPIAPGLRSLNVAMAAAMALGEATRQIGSPVMEAAR